MTLLYVKRKSLNSFDMNNFIGVRTVRDEYYRVIEPMINNNFSKIVFTQPHILCSYFEGYRHRKVL